MHIENIIQTIKNDEFNVFHADDFGFSNYSDVELISLFMMSIDQTSNASTHAGIQALPKNTKNLIKITDLIKQLNIKNLTEYLSKFPSSFRINNVQLLIGKMMEENNKIFDQANLSFFTNLYFTPNSNHNALDLHFDHAHIFIHQIRGNKNWMLLNNYKNGEYLRTDLTKIDIANMTQGKTEITLRENQLLYIPIKIPHKAMVNNDKSSIHLTYAFREISTKDSVIDFIISKMLQDINFKDNRFEILMDHEADIIKKVSDYFKHLDIESMANELAIKQTLQKKAILKNGMRMG